MAAHALAVWGLLHDYGVREAVVGPRPLFVSLIARQEAEQPIPEIRPFAGPPAFRAPSIPVPTPPEPITVADPMAPEPEHREFSETISGASLPAQVLEALAVPDPPASPPEPRTIPASAVQYLEPIVLEYPSLSKKLRETGLVMVRVFIDQSGIVKSTQLSCSSGFTRLDVAAMAAVQNARFKPYMENGRALAGWAVIPLEFELET